MNARRLLLQLSVASLTSICACATYQGGTSGTDVSARVSYSNADYYDDYYHTLSLYGTWEQGSYGDCWVPLDVPVGWRPYTEGYWVATDYGWMWISHDPWGGVPYHYGRWAEDDHYGWVWVPDNDWIWAPAWVSWRYGGGYVGWAPLPPNVGWQGRSGLTVSVTVLEQRIPRDTWCFAPAREFGRTTRIRASVLPVARNVTLISRTQNVTRYEVVDSRPAERGLSPEIIQRDTGRRFQRYQVTDASSPRSNRIRGRTVEVYRPSASEVKDRRPKPTAEARSAPSRAVVQHLDEEQRRFDQRMQQERNALGREQERELKQRRQSQEQTEQIRQRHQAEMQAQQEREDRERRALDRKRRIVEDREAKGKDNSQDKREPDRGKSKHKKQDNRDRDRDRNRDGGNGGG